MLVCDALIAQSLHFQKPNTTGFTETQVRNKAEAEVEYIEFRKLLDHSIVQLRSIETKLKDKSIPYIKGKDENWKGE